MCSECSRGAYDADKLVRPCEGEHRYIWDSKREFRFCESCSVEETEEERDKREHEERKRELIDILKTLGIGGESFVTKARHYDSHK